ncbi:endo-b1,4-mannanase 5C [Klebsiella pneumoniae]|uniref:Endo-b1,4-mannanase 5C n=1 Tax=Klebsiella pneumoniae TaxID=573 RepID=A0A377XM34_KLEPN|nr:endo-b1,4-mannanase 5C [Klebsiella pneumoniae]
MKPMKNLLLMGLLSALGAGGALAAVEDDARGPCRADPRGWGQYFKWPTAQEQQNWIQAMVQTGAKAQRVYVLSVQQEFDKACGRETHILAPETADGMPRLNEKAMRVYDNMIAEADKQGLRLICRLSTTGGGGAGASSLRRSIMKKRKTFIGPIARPSKPIWM